MALKHSLLFKAEMYTGPAVDGTIFFVEAKRTTLKWGTRAIYFHPLVLAELPLFAFDGMAG